MKRLSIVLLVIAFCSTSCSTSPVSVDLSCADVSVDKDLFGAARKVLPEDVSSKDLVRALGEGLWNSNHTAVAISVPTTNASRVFIFIQQPGGTYSAFDVSSPETASHKWGHRYAYERFETTPLKWVRLWNGLEAVEMRTRFWSPSGQRYTVYVNVAVKADGTLYWT